MCKPTLQVQNRLLFWGFFNPTPFSMTNAKVRTTKDRSREMLGQDCSRRNNLRGQISTEMILQFHPELIRGQDHLYVCWFLQIDFGAGLTAMRINLDEANTEEVWDHSTNCRCVSRFIGSLCDLPIICSSFRSTCCVTQLKLDTVEKLSSPIFCCLCVCEASVTPDQISTFSNIYRHTSPLLTQYNI